MNGTLHMHSQRVERLVKESGSIVSPPFGYSTGLIRNGEYPLATLCSKGWFERRTIMEFEHPNPFILLGIVNEKLRFTCNSPE
ncbi:hypothetical protein GV64_09275 [Endozoicomonas elysicola]|uniref:Uncharacterized protein n=1 Tax=Endozoicomonas elysicola TaxID=305900 RepID=A0A081K9T3_9GAMM|nr:hypothetical protein GV64_09275 [Endozoicomonas elysicola]